jgi:hypothetical protein
MRATRMAERRWLGVGSSLKWGWVVFATAAVVVVVVVGAVAGVVWLGGLAVVVPNREVGLAMRTTPARAMREASCSLRVKGSLRSMWQM